jgi:hypothetical protein
MLGLVYASSVFTDCIFKVMELILIILQGM